MPYLCFYMCKSVVDALSSKPGLEDFEMELSGTGQESKFLIQLLRAIHVSLTIGQRKALMMLPSPHSQPIAEAI